MKILDFKGCYDFFDRYFKEFSFLGIVNNGKYKRTANINTLLFGATISFYFGAFILVLVDPFKEQCAKYFILIFSNIFFYGALFWRNEYLKHRFDVNSMNNKDKRPEFDRKRDFVINYLTKNYGQVSSIILKQYLNNLRNKIANEKLKQNVWIGTALIFLTTALGTQFANLDYEKSDFNEVFTLILLFSIALGFFIYLQYNVAVGKTWKLGLYIELELTLDLFYEIFKEDEAYQSQRNLIEKLNENRAKQRCAIDRFFC